LKGDLWIKGLRMMVDGDRREVEGGRRKVEVVRSLAAPIYFGYVGVDPGLIDVALVGTVHPPD